MNINRGKWGKGNGKQQTPGEAFPVSRFPIFGFLKENA